MTAVDDLIRQVEATIEEEGLLARGDKIVVAVSGGPDSVALLHVLFSLAKKWDWQLVAAHVNHRFRPAESEKEAEQVRLLAARLDVPFAYAQIDVPAYASERGLNPQAAAREKRYAFLHEAANQYGATKLALAHHADDQAETVLMRIIHGTGLTGLAGIPIKRTEKNLQLIRPLLRNTKRELENYCRAAGLAYCIDSSNLQRKYVRNRIRLDVLPLLSSINPEIRGSLNRLAAQAEVDGGLLDALAMRRYAVLVVEKQSECTFARFSFLKLHVALQRRMIKLILSYLAAKTRKTAFLARFSDFRTIETMRVAIARDAPSTLRLDIGGALRFIREYERIRIVSAAALAKPRHYLYHVAAVPARLWIAEAGCTLTFETADAATVMETGDQNTAVFDFDRLRFPLAVRNRRDGDRMRPQGLNGSKKVKNMFIDDKVPPENRDCLPLIIDAGGTILWIPQLRRSDHAAVGDRTTRVLIIRANFE
ncbi:MAG TPA: tRNA lysidine(34) synthetase TilS [Bacilli bacterium]